MAEKVGLPTEVVFGAEILLDFLLLRQLRKLLLGENKVALYLTCFLASNLSYAFYNRVTGPALIGEAPGVKRNNFKELAEN
jgi:hypothetical protein